MRPDSRLLNPRLVDYIAKRSAADDHFLCTLKQAAAEAGIPAIWIAPEQAAFMHILLSVSAVRTVVEIGTLAGYSAIAMARALPADGRVQTIEVDPEYAAFARQWIGCSDVAERIEVIEGVADTVLGALADASVDAVFIDADKEGYAGYLEHAARLLRPGALLMVDNAFCFGELLEERPQDPDHAILMAFNEQIAAHPAFRSTIVAVGDGLWIGVRR